MSHWRRLLAFGGSVALHTAALGAILLLALSLRQPEPLFVDLTAGAIAGAAIIIGEEVITRPGSVAIALAALALLLQRKVKMPEPAIVAMAAGVGIAAFG